MEVEDVEVGAGQGSVPAKSTFPTTPTATTKATANVPKSMPASTTTGAPIMPPPKAGTPKLQQQAGTPTPPPKAGTTSGAMVKTKAAAPAKAAPQSNPTPSGDQTFLANTSAPSVNWYLRGTVFVAESLEDSNKRVKKNLLIQSWFQGNFVSTTSPRHVCKQVTP